MYFGLNIETQGAWSVTSLSTWAHRLFAEVGSVIPSVPALSMFAYPLVAELGDVRARVAVRVERAAPEQDVQEVRGRRIVLIPARVRELRLVARVLHIRVLDVRREGLKRGLVAE